MAARSPSLDELPLFASEEALAAALMGAGNLVKWKSMAPLLERRGLPSVDPEFGGRYVPAVKAFLDNRYGLATSPPRAPPGEADFTTPWKKRDLKHRA